MYQFQVSAYTQMGESINLVGSTPELGLWEVTRSVHLRTSAERYPLWWTDTEIDIQPSLMSGDRQRVEYKYVRFDANGSVRWEALGPNRWVPINSDDQSNSIVVDDGAFGYLQPYPFGYIKEPAVRMPLDEGSCRLKIVVIGSSVALGHKAWLLRGWAWLLGQALQQKYGHQLVNVSEVGANVSKTLDRFASVVMPEQPDIVIIALSLGNEGLAYCPPHERRAVQRRFESGLQQLVKMTWDMGSRPILGGVYPNGDYSPEHHWHERMRVRYTARSQRFWYTLQNCDKALFVRTGIADRGGVIDLVNKLEKQCQKMPFHLLLLSPQASDEFLDLTYVLHYNLEFNPDRMYEDLGHWMYCTEVMRGILESLEVSSKNLFWCPPKPPQDTPKA